MTLPEVYVFLIGVLVGVILAGLIGAVLIIRALRR